MDEHHREGRAIYVEDVEEGWILSLERDEPVHWEEDDNDGTENYLENSDFTQFDDRLLKPVLVLLFDVVIFELLRKEVLLIRLTHIV